LKTRYLLLKSSLLGQFVKVFCNKKTWQSVLGDFLQLFSRRNLTAVVRNKTILAAVGAVFCQQLWKAAFVVVDLVVI